MKKIISLLLIAMLLLTACNKKEEQSMNNVQEEQNNLIHEHCVRYGNAGEGAKTNLEYDIYYTGDVLNKLSSLEQVISDDKYFLDSYENAYKTIHSYYKDLSYYETKVIREDNSVTSLINIDYDKIDISKLISIEGDEDNIFENNIPKVSKWKELAKKFGTKCEKA